MKKYLLIAYDTYYPRRGLNNIQAMSDDMDALLEYHFADKSWKYNHYAIFDRDTLKVIWSSDGETDSPDEIQIIEKK